MPMNFSVRVSTKLAEIFISVMALLIIAIIFSWCISTAILAFRELFNG
jgi:hypothetical protein